MKAGIAIAYGSIVSIARLKRLLASDASLTAADTQALILVMRLHCEPRSNSTDLYYKAARVALTVMEHHGQFSTNYLGARALLAVHEIGQGMFPAAWLSVSSLISLHCALGLHDKLKAVQILRRPG